MKKVLSAISLILVAGIIVTVFGLYAYKKIKDSGKEQTAIELDIVQNALEEGAGAIVKVEESMDVAAVAALLVEENVIKYKDEFIEIANGAELRDTYIAGSYRILPGIPYLEIAKQLSRKSDNAILKFTIPEGFELKQIAQRLEKQGLVQFDKFYEIMKTETFEYSFLKDIPKRDNYLEGYLFPDTYEVRVNSGEKFIIDMLLKRFDNVFSEEYRKQAKKIGMSIDEVVILASIIERESANADENHLISSVFHNRLDDGMKLQSCATVQYILQERKPRLSIAETKIDSPYNTYMKKSLPVGPIASPGKASIDAALFPEKSEYFYFVLGKDGKHIFSKTYEEHRKSIDSGVGVDNVEAK